MTGVQTCALPISVDAWSIHQALLKQFFSIKDGLLIHTRIEAELENSKSKKVNAVEKARIAAKKRWENRTSNTPSNAPSNAPSNQQAMLESCPSPSPSPSEKKELKTIVRFEDFWKTYPASDRKVAKVKCQEKWKAKNCDSIADKIIADVESKKMTKQFMDFTPAPLTYLNQERWNDSEQVAGVELTREEKTRAWMMKMNGL